jgi:hypothetical protein
VTSRDSEAIEPRRDRLDRSFWVVTSYYNPAGYRSRRENYQHFRRRVQAPLLTVELAPPGRFELGAADADRLVQVEGTDVLWQKERLINLALDQLPPECSELAWVDCDVIFASDSWVEDTRRALRDHPLVQCFTRMRYLPREARLSAPLAEQTYFMRPSLAARLRQGDDVFAAGCASFATGVRQGVQWGHAAGVAWSMRRDLLARVGLYDAMIVGGGDGAFVQAALGQPERAAQVFRYSPAHAEHYCQWAAEFGGIAKGGIGVVEGDIYHLWHGSLRDRRYHLRHGILRKFAFDPQADIAVAESGCWRWSSEKPDLHRAVAEFFVKRREDG